MKSGNKSILADPVIVLMALFSVFLHLIFLNNLEYHRDELLYFSLGLHPSVGFATVPPMIGWISFIMEHLIGYSVFAVRLFPAIIGGVMILLAASMARELGGSRYATILAATGLFISIFFLRTFFLFMPVFMELFLWTLIIFLVIKYINTEKDIFLVLLGIASGFALLNKYLVTLLLLSLIVTIPFSRYRNVFRLKMFWVGIAAGFIVFLPNLLWQVSKGFPVFHHMSELYDTQLVYMDVPLFLKEQLLMPFAGTVFTVAGLIFLLFGKEARKYRILGFVALFVIAGLMLLRGKSYYTLGVFPLLIAAGAVSYDHWLKRRWIRIALPLFLVLMTIPVLPMGVPVFNAEGLVKYFKDIEVKFGMDVGRRFEDGSIHSLPQDYADMLGWEELTSVAARAYQGVPDKKSCFIYCENYGQAGAITIIGRKYNLPEAICFSESFRYWIPESFNPDITSVVYINHDEPGEDVRSFFRKITKVGGITNPDAREYGTSVYLCEDPVDSFNKFWKERISRLK